MPSFGARGNAVAGTGMIYSLSYGFDSNSAAHPNPLALEQFLEERDGVIVIRDEPKGPRPDPYLTGAWLFLGLVKLVGDHVDQTALAPRLARIETRLQELTQEDSRRLRDWGPRGHA